MSIINEYTVWKRRLVRLYLSFECGNVVTGHKTGSFCTVKSERREKTESLQGMCRHLTDDKNLTETVTLQAAEVILNR